MSELDRGLAAEAEFKLPRVAMLESEYLRAVTVAELEWVRSIVDDLRAGRLHWTWEGLAAFAEAADQPAE